MDDKWEWNGPEEGDKIDLSVVIMFEGEEVLQLVDNNETTVSSRKQIAMAICTLLNQVGAVRL